MLATNLYADYTYKKDEVTELRQRLYNVCNDAKKELLKKDPKFELGPHNCDFIKENIKISDIDCFNLETDILFYLAKAMHDLLIGEDTYSDNAIIETAKNYCEQNHDKRHYASEITSYGYTNIKEKNIECTKISEDNFKCLRNVVAYDASKNYISFTECWIFEYDQEAQGLRKPKKRSPIIFENNNVSLKLNEIDDNCEYKE